MTDRISQRGGWAKRTLLAIFCVVFALSLVPSGALSAYAAPSEEADATEDGVVSTLADTWDGENIDTDWYTENPGATEFTLTTAAQLAGLAVITTSGTDKYAQDDFAGKTVKLGADIDLNNISWNPISDVNTNSGVAWQGTFDGCGHYIVNLNVEALATNSGGIRGFISVIGVGGVVRNVGITGEVHGRICGGIVGETNFTASQTNMIGINEWPRIENCYAAVAVTGDGSGRRAAGGIFGGDSNNAGNMFCHIINCYSVGNISNRGTAGGLAGITAGIVSGSYATGTVSSTSNYLGGNVGSMYLEGYNSVSFTARGYYADNNMTTTSPSYRYYSGTMDDNGDPISVVGEEGKEGVGGVYSAEYIKDNGVSILGEHAWEQGDNGPVLYWQNGGSDYDISTATVTVNSDNTVTVTFGGNTLVEYTDYFAVGEGEDVIVYGVGRYTGEADPGEGGVSTWDGSVDIDWYKENPDADEFTLTSAAQLAGLAAITTSDTDDYDQDNFAGKTINLGADMDLDGKSWNPISDVNTNSSVAWQGTFDGCGHTITGLNVDGETPGVQGFISVIGIGGVVRNVSITGKVSGWIAGGIVGETNFDASETNTISIYEWPRIENCYAGIAVTGNGSDRRAAAGGIFGGDSNDSGNMYCNIINCYSVGDVSNDAGTAGGLAGITAGIVAGSYAIGTISGTSDYFGGNVGSMYMKGFVPGSQYNFTAQGTYVNNMTTTSPSYRYYSGNSGDSGTPVSVSDGVYNDTQIQTDGVKILGEHAWKTGTEKTDGYPQLYWQAGESDIDLSDAIVTVNSDNTVTVTLGTDTLVEYTDYFVVGEDYDATVYGVGRYTGTAQPIFFTIYTQVEGSGEEATIAKEYAKAEFEDLAVDSAEPVSGLYYKNESWNVDSTDYYVTLSALYDDANINSSYVTEVTVNDDSISANELDQQNKFFPDATANGEPINPDNAVDVPAVFSITEHSSAIGEKGTETAEQAQAYNLDQAGSDNEPRFICGISQDQYEKQSVDDSRLQKNCKSLTVTLSSASLADASVEVPNYEYTHSEITPEVTVTLGDVTLTEGTDYTVAYSRDDADDPNEKVDLTNIGTVTATITGIGRYTDTKTTTFEITPADIAQCNIAAIPDQQALSGRNDDPNKQPYQPLTPDPTVTDNRSAGFGMQGFVLVEGTDYEVTYDNNIFIGTATVTITGTGNYESTTSTTFEIVPYFTVYSQIGEDGEEEIAGEYAKSEFETLAIDGSDPVSGMFFTTVWRVATTSNYVTVDDILEDSGLYKYWNIGEERGAGATLYYGSEGSTHSVTYEDLAKQCYFFPDAEGGLSNNPTNAVKTPAVLSVREYSVSTGSDEALTAYDAEKYNINYMEQHPDEAYKNEPRMLYGISEEDYVSQSGSGVGGNRYWSNCTYLKLVVPADFKYADVTGIDESYTFTGKEICPTPTVTLGGVELQAGVDYEVTYSNNVNPGTATITITPLGEYAGQDPITVTFEITTETNTMTVYAGDDRYETAALINTTVSESGPYDGVIVCSGENGKFADALCASGLSGVLNYPIVITNGSAETLDAKTTSTISSLLSGGSGNIIVLGGTATVSDGIASNLSDYYGSVERVAGDDRYATAQEVYTYGTNHGTWSTDYAIVAKGNDYPDALGAASFCASFAVPMLLTDQNSDMLESYVVNAANKAGEAIIVGGSTSVSDAKASALGNNERMAGDDRYATNLMFANWQINHGMVLNGVGVATGASFPDSLGSSSLLALTHSVLLLVAPTGTESAAASNVNVYNLLADNADNIYEISVFGGTNSVPDGVKRALRNAIGGIWEVIDK